MIAAYAAAHPRARLRKGEDETDGADRPPQT